VVVGARASWKSHILYHRNFPLRQAPQSNGVVLCGLVELVLVHTGRQTRKAKNLAGNSHCVIVTRKKPMKLILEGTRAEAVSDRAPGTAD